MSESLLSPFLPLVRDSAYVRAVWDTVQRGDTGRASAIDAARRRSPRRCTACTAARPSWSRPARPRSPTGRGATGLAARPDRRRPVPRDRGVPLRAPARRPRDRRRAPGGARAAGAGPGGRGMGARGQGGAEPGAVGLGPTARPTARPPGPGDSRAARSQQRPYTARGHQRAGVARPVDATGGVADAHT